MKALVYILIMLTVMAPAAVTAEDSKEKVFWADLQICFPEPQPEPVPKVPDSPYDKDYDRLYISTDDTARLVTWDHCIQVGLRHDGVLVWRNQKDDDE